MHPPPPLPVITGSAVVSHILIQPVIFHTKENSRREGEKNIKKKNDDRKFYSTGEVWAGGQKMSLINKLNCYLERDYVREKV